MTIAVVKFLEEVDVHYDQGKSACGALRTRKFLLQSRIQVATVAQSGKTVLVRQAFKKSFGVFARSQIRIGAHDAAPDEGDGAHFENGAVRTLALVYIAGLADDARVQTRLELVADIVELST